MSTAITAQPSSSQSKLSHDTGRPGSRSSPRTTAVAYGPIGGTKPTNNNNGHRKTPGSPRSPNEDERNAALSIQQLSSGQFAKTSPASRSVRGKKERVESVFHHQSHLPHESRHTPPHLQDLKHIRHGLLFSKVTLTLTRNLTADPNPSLIQVLPPYPRSKLNDLPHLNLSNAHLRNNNFNNLDIDHDDST